MSIVDDLLIIQERDCEIRNLENDLKMIPVKKEQEKIKLDGHRKLLADSEALLKQWQAKIKELELEIQTNQQKINKLRQQQLELKTNKEFRAMDDEVKAVIHEISQLEEKQLEMMEQSEKVKLTTLSLKGALSKEEIAVQGEVKVWDSREVELGVKLKELRVVREDAANKVDPEWKKRYEKVFSRKDRALVSVKDGVCGGCHMKLPRYVVHDTKRQVEIVTCEFCGRLLY